MKRMKLKREMRRQVNDICVWYSSIQMISGLWEMTNSVGVLWKVLSSKWKVFRGNAYNNEYEIIPTLFFEICWGEGNICGVKMVNNEIYQNIWNNLKMKVLLVCVRNEKETNSLAENESMKEVEMKVENQSSFFGRGMLGKSKQQEREIYNIIWNIKNVCKLRTVGKARRVDVTLCEAKM